MGTVESSYDNVVPISVTKNRKWINVGGQHFYPMSAVVRVVRFGSDPWPDSAPTYRLQIDIKQFTVSTGDAPSRRCVIRYTTPLMSEQESEKLLSQMKLTCHKVKKTALDEEEADESSNKSTTEHE